MAWHVRIPWIHNLPPMIKTALNGVNRLLYLCSLRKEPMEPESLQRSLSEIRDWDAFLHKARAHKLQLRLYSFLKRGGAGSLLAADIWEKIEKEHRWAQAYTLALEGELRTVLLPAFNQAGIDVLLLKGAAFLETVYQNKPLRFFLDLDLMIRGKNFSKAREVLRALGYCAAPVYPALDQPHYEFMHPQRNIPVDLHLEPFEAWSAFSLKADWLWENAHPAGTNSSRAFLPEPSRLFLFHLFHLVKHAIAGENVFGWYADLDECLRYFTREIDGRFCRDQIHRSSEILKITETLASLNAYFSTPFPDEFRSLVDDLKPIPLNKLFAPRSGPAFPSPGSSRRFLFFWSRVSGWRGRFALLWNWLFPDESYLRSKYSFRNFHERVTARFKHLVSMGLKGLCLGLYYLRNIGK